MGWKSVALAGCLLPVLAGCGSVRTAPAELQVARAPLAAAGDLRSGAGAAWQRVRTENPGRDFSDEFRDGFLDGFSHAVARGQDPPARPTQGNARPPSDYRLGFGYGSEVAATGWAPPLPAGAARPLPPGATQPATAATESLPADRRIPRLPKPEIPVIPPFDPPLPGGNYPLVPVPPATDLPPVPRPSRPATLPISPDESNSAIPPTTLPTLPASMVVSFPSKPESIRVPSLFDDIPAMPFQYPTPEK
jgi:hypothetical protein